MGWCALIRRIHMDIHCRQHIGIEEGLYCDCVGGCDCVCMYTMYVRMYVHICVALLSRCVQQLKLTDLDTSQPSTVQYIVDHSRFTKLSGLSPIPI